jgi:hypothetical protein
MKQSAALALAAFRDHPEGLTALEAETAVGYSLAQRVFDLKAEGYRFAETWVTTATAKRVKRWRLVERPEPIRGRQTEAFA